jgi:poly-beta-1,6-N-acetyl-D-glucosamine N-deacetylase
MLSGKHLMSLHRKLLLNAKVRLTRHNHLALAIAPSLAIGFFLYLAWIQSHNSERNPQIVSDKKPFSNPPEQTFKLRQNGSKFIGLVAEKIADTVPLSLKQSKQPSCPTKPQSPVAQITRGINGSVLVAQRVTGLETERNRLLLKLVSMMASYSNISPWPTINERAKLAKVPVIMYHDILPKKEVFFDVTPKQLERHFQLIQKTGMTPISFDELVTHLRTGKPLPAKPILLTFDDGYGGHYEYVYPLLKKYNYPATFSIYTSKVGINTGRTHVSWEQLRRMVADPLVTIASHSVTHPPDLRQLPDDKLKIEIVESKRILESKLGIPIRYFTYPVGKYDERVANVVKQAGYAAALTMSDRDERYAGESESLLAIARFGQSNLAAAINQPEGNPILQAWGGPPLASDAQSFDFAAPVQHKNITIDDISLTLISGGRPITVHGAKRDRLPKILKGTSAIAAVDGGFFSLKDETSNVMIGPVFSQNTKQFIPGNDYDNSKIGGRPLVLISPQAVKFIPYDPKKHNSLKGIQAAMPKVTDAFVAAAWLVKNGQPQPYKSFGNLYGFDAKRHRAFWGISHSGQPKIGISQERVDSVSLAVALSKAGYREAVMVDSGASTSLTYQGKLLVKDFVPRPVPHAVALLPPTSNIDSLCVAASP